MKKNRRLAFAWSIFIFAMVAFVILTKMYYHFQKEHASNYQYRILISKDLSGMPEVSSENQTSKHSPSNEKKDKLSKNFEERYYEHSKFGLIPKISADGKKVMDAYSADFQKSIDDASIKKIHLILWIDDVVFGTTEKVLSIINKLKNDKITFIIPHYIDNQASIARAIIENGHEFFIQIPTQSSIQNEKKGEVSAFLANANTEDMMDKLMYLLASSKYAIGIANATSTLLTKSKKDLEIIIEELSKRGLAFLDLEKSNELLKDLSKKEEVPYINATDTLETKNSDEKIEISNFTDGKILAIRIGNIDKFLTEYSKHKGFVLAPVSAVMKSKNENNASI